MNLRREHALKGSSIKRSKKLIKIQRDHQFLGSSNDSCKSNKSEQKSSKKKGPREINKAHFKKSTSNKAKTFQQSIKGSVKKFNKCQEKKDTRKISFTNQLEKPLTTGSRKSKSLYIPKRKPSTNFLGVIIRLFLMVFKFSRSLMMWLCQILLPCSNKRVAFQRNVITYPPQRLPLGRTSCIDSSLSPATALSRLWNPEPAPPTYLCRLRRSRRPVGAKS